MVKPQMLEPERIVETVDLLQRRIGERFPESSLRKVCGELLDIARQAQDLSEKIGRPIVVLRLATAVLILAVLGSTVWAVLALRPPDQQLDLIQFVQVLEAAINDLVLIGAGIFFLATLEVRIKRNRALGPLHDLRSMAHLIDMHQLTKDPERILYRGRETASSPRQQMTAFELNRYLDYCTEMLSLVGKIAALYVRKFDDSVVLTAAGEVEELTTDLSRKIWQKIMLVHSLKDWEAEPADGSSTPASSSPEDRSPEDGPA
jgi:hypothetical protein